MDLVYSAAFFGLAVILLILLLREDRMLGKFGWASEGVIADLWCVAIAGLIAFGAAFGVQFALTMNEQAFGLTEAALVAAILSVCYLSIRTMAPRPRLAQYTDEFASGHGAGASSPARVITPTSAEGNNRSLAEPA